LKVALAAAPTWSLIHLEFAELLVSEGAAVSDIWPHLEAAKKGGSESARLHYLEGLAHESSSELPEAILAYEKALALRSQFGEARIRLARLLVNSSRWTEATPQLRQVVRETPESTSAWVMLAQALRAMGDKRGEEDALLEATRRAPKNSYHWQRLALFYESLGNSKKAARARAKANLHSPKRRERQLRPLPDSRR